MNRTPNLGLKKPEASDPIDISVLNENADTLDSFAGETNTALAAKQDSISDISEIRSGAAAGATAVQPADMSAALAAKQDKLTFDSAPTESSMNPVTSGGVWTDQQRQDALQSEDRAALIEQVDGGAKNLVNLNTDFTTHTYRGITYTNNHDGTINVSGTSTSTNSYVTLYDRNTDNLFGIQKGETVVLRSTSDNVSINLVYKKSDGSYGLTVYGYKSTPGRFTIPSDFVGFLLRIGVPKNETTVNENVGGMICTATDYAVSPKIVPYAPTNRELYDTCETKVTLQQVYGDAIPIPAESDLNSYTTPGTYYALVANVPTIANTPYTATGLRLAVEKNTPSGAAVFQTIYPTSRSHLEFYRRVYEGGSWSSWCKFEGTVVS